MSYVVYGRGGLEPSQWTSIRGLGEDFPDWKPDAKGPPCETDVGTGRTMGGKCLTTRCKEGFETIPIFEDYVACANCFGDEFAVLDKASGTVSCQKGKPCNVTNGMGVQHPVKGGACRITQCAEGFSAKMDKNGVVTCKSDSSFDLSDPAVLAGIAVVAAAAYMYVSRNP